MSSAQRRERKSFLRYGKIGKSGVVVVVFSEVDLLVDTAPLVLGMAALGKLLGQRPLLSPMPLRIKRMLSSLPNTDEDDSVSVTSAPPFGHLSTDHLALKDASRSLFMSKFNPLLKRMDDEDWFPHDA